MKNKEELINSLKQLSQTQPQGFTVDLNMNHISKGFAVAVIDTQDSFGEEGLENVAEFAIENDLSIGGWFSEDNQKFYWDAVKVINNKKEAIGFGKLNQQFAIFDLEEQELIII
ncbi:MAG: hypothetical protein CL666_08690 [Balneola sp.]|nr:hypothetical protein [Balneola sp.]|tara:strand:+ start:15291 stop:15632 length:342 start_codon:yes stop_codon:yes gene_type:complete